MQKPQWPNLAKAFRRLTVAASWLWAGPLLLWNLLRFYPGDRWTPVRMGNYFAPWLLLPALPVLLVALWGRRRWLLGATVLLLLIFAGRYGALFLPRWPPTGPNPTTASFRVMTFNVNVGNHDVQAIAQLVRSNAPDVIAMQEVHPKLYAALQEELATEYPYQLISMAYNLPLALFSRYPLTARSAPPRVWRVLRADVATPEGPISVWNLHPALSFERDGWQVQRESLLAVVNEIERESGPVIVMGDINTTAQTDNYRLFSGQLVDVHREAGWGWGFTFPAGKAGAPGMGNFWPMLRIDHILVSEHFWPEEIYTDKGYYGSDHRPLIAQLRWFQGGTRP